jgi:hypothetical protein
VVLVDEACGVKKLDSVEISATTVAAVLRAFASPGFLPAVAAQPPGAAPAARFPAT